MIHRFLALCLAFGLFASTAFAQSGPFSNPAGGGTTPPQIGGRAWAMTSTAAPTLTASATPVMCGCAAVIKANGSVQVVATFSVTNSVATDGGAFQLAWGTGPAPANGAAPVGTVIGGLKTFTSGTTTPGKVGFALSGIFAPGVDVSQPIWVDIQFKAVTGGNLTLTTVDVTVSEL